MARVAWMERQLTFTPTSGRSSLRRERREGRGSRRSGGSGGGVGPAARLEQKERGPPKEEAGEGSP